MSMAAPVRNAWIGGLNCLLVLAWAGITIWLLAGSGFAGSPFLLVLIAGAPLACFYAFRVSFTRVVAFLLIAAALGYLKEYLAAGGGVWFHYASPGVKAEGLLPLHTAFIMGFSALAAIAIAEALDHTLNLRRCLRSANLYLNSGIMLVVFAVLIVLMAVEDGGLPGNAAAASPAFIAFYLALGLLAWYFATVARTGRLLSLLLAGGLICLVGDHLGALSGLWSFHAEVSLSLPEPPAYVPGWMEDWQRHANELLMASSALRSTHGGTDVPWFLVLASWPLEVFVWYSLGAVAGDRVVLHLRGARAVGHDVLTRGALDRLAPRTARRQSYLVALALAAAIAGMVHERAVITVGSDAAPDRRYLFALVLAVVFTAAAMVAQRAYWLRVLWLFGLGAAFGLSLSYCGLLDWNTAAGSDLFTLPVWGMVAIAAYGLGALLARGVSAGGEWLAVDRGGSLAAAVAVIVVAALLLIGHLSGAAVVETPGVEVAALAALTVAALSAAAAWIGGLSTALPLILLGVGYLFSAGHLSEAWQMLSVLLFVPVAAHLGYKALVEVRARTYVAFALSAMVLSVLVIAGGRLCGLIAGDFPWYLALGLLPLLLMACCTISASGAGVAQNVTAHGKPRRLDVPPFAPRTPAARRPGAVSRVALATAGDGDGCSRAGRATTCLRRALSMLDEDPSARGAPISRYISPGGMVFIKPNVVLPLYSPCVVLPELVRELARLCLDAEGGAAGKVRIGETSLSEFTARQTLESTGFREYWEAVDERITVELLDESAWVPVERDPEDPEPFRWLPRTLCECDSYINVSKLKTHYITEVTLSIKNSLGLLLDDDKWIDHRGCFRNVHSLARKLVRIMRARPPELVIIDGFDGLEGDGPFVGSRVDTEFIIASTDPVAADCVGAALMGRTVDEVATCRIGAELGLGTADWRRIEVVTEEGVITDLPAGLDRRVHNFARPEKAPEEHEKDFNIGPIRLVSHDNSEQRAGPWSTLYGVLSLIRPMAEVYFVHEWEKLRGLTLVYGELKTPVEAELALLFGDRAIASRHLVYAPTIWEVPGEIPNRYLVAMDQIAWGGDAKIVKLISTALRKTKGDYL